MGREHAEKLVDAFHVALVTWLRHADAAGPVETTDELDAATEELRDARRALLDALEDAEDTGDDWPE